MLATIIGVAVLSTIALGFFAHGSIDFAYYATFTRLSGLLLGSAFAFSFAPYRIRGEPGPGARLALDAVGVFGLFILLASFGVLHRFGLNGFSFPTSTHDNLAVFHGGFLLVDIATLLVIAAAVHPASDVGRALGCRPLQWVGLRSYSLYLWHYPIFCITRPGLDIHRLGIWFLSIDFAGWPVFVVRLGPVVRRGRTVVPVHRDADPQRRHRPLSRGRARRSRRTATTARPARRRHRQLAHAARVHARHRPRDRASASTEHSRSRSVGFAKRGECRPERAAGAETHVAHLEHHSDDEGEDRNDGQGVEADDHDDATEAARARARHRRLGDARRGREPDGDDPGHGGRRDPQPSVQSGHPRRADVREVRRAPTHRS